MTFSIIGSRYARASCVTRAVLYTASECTGCFDRARMHNEIAALAVGESVTYPALHLVGGRENPDPITITRES